MINFLRGVPSDKFLEKIRPLIAKGYEHAILKYGTEVLQYGHFGGFRPLREILAKVHHVAPERIVAGNGGLEVISLFFKALPAHSTIIIEQATYDRVAIDARQYGHQIIGVRMTPQGADMDDLERLLRNTPATLFYGIPFHQNPTGITYSEENRNAVEAMCKQHGVTCAWDVCYQSLRYDGNTNVPVKVSDSGPVLFDSFTKTISPGTKCGYMVLPKEMVGHVTDVAANTRINPNLPTQAFIADFMESGKYDQALDTLREMCKPKMDALNMAMSSYFPETNPIEITGGFFAGITFPDITEEKEERFIKSVRKAGVNIDSYQLGFAPNILEEHRGKGFFIRITFPALEPEQIEKGIAILNKARGEG